MTPEKGTADYTITLNHYFTEEGQITADDVADPDKGEEMTGVREKTKTVELRKLRKLTVCSDVPNPTITLWVDGDNRYPQEGDSIYVPIDVDVKCKVSAEHYDDKIETYRFSTWEDPDVILTINPELTKHELRITTDPYHSKIVFKYDDVTITSDDAPHIVRIPWGKTVRYTITADPYGTVSDEVQILQNTEIFKELPLTPGSIFFESSTSQTITKNFKSGKYEVILVGGGGRGAGWSNWLYGELHGGGGGAYLRFRINLSSNTYPITVGHGGSTSGDSNGGASSVFGQSAGGGFVSGSAAGGAGGTVNVTSSSLEILNSLPGNPGVYNQQYGWYWSGSAAGGASRYGGYGYGGNSRNTGNASYKNDPGGTGYVKITYIGPIS